MVPTNYQEHSKRKKQGSRYAESDRPGHPEIQERKGRTREDVSRDTKLGVVQINDESCDSRSKSEGQLLEDVKAGGLMLTSALISQSGRPVLTSPNDDDPLTIQNQAEEFIRTRYPNEQRSDLSLIDGGLGAIPSSIGAGRVTQEEMLREVAKDQGIPEDFERGRGGYSEESRRDGSKESIPERKRRDLSEQGQSSIVSDNQVVKSRSAISKSEGQLLEDVKAGGLMLTSALISQCGRPVLSSPNDDDPLVYSKAVDQLRRKEVVKAEPRC
jgi:hypothetical protein